LAQGIRDAVLVRTGYTCNSYCRFCNQGDARERLGDRPASDVESDILEAADRGVKTLVLAGGEATLREEIHGWVRTARMAGMTNVVIQSNGRMLAYSEFTRELIDAGARVFAIALHGATEACHDYHTRSPGSFRQTIKGIRRVRELGAKVIVNTVITRSNFRHLSEIVGLCHRLGVGTIRLIWPAEEGEALINAPRMIPNPDLVQPHLVEAKAFGTRLGRRVLVTYPESTKESDTYVSSTS
jgi:MoaA/NifB/PqqE/SkfB family radical SAM enzyme